MRSPLPALLLALLAGGANAQLGGSRTPAVPDKPLERPSPEMPQWLRDKPNAIQDADALGRKELFRLQDMLFAFIDPGNNGEFVRQRDDGSREALVRIDNRADNKRHQFLFRAGCKDNTYYLGPPAGRNVPLKPADAGSVAELLLKEACG